MIRTITSTFALTGLLALSGAGLLNAQVPTDSSMSMHGMRGMGMMEHCPIMAAMVKGPAAALEHRDTLDLSSGQVERLEALRREMAETHRVAMQRMRELHEEMMAVGRRAQEQTAQVLTAEQNQLLEGLRPADMHRMHGMHGMRGMMPMDSTMGMGGMGRMHGMTGMMRHCMMMHGGMHSASGHDGGGH